MTIITIMIKSSKIYPITSTQTEIIQNGHQLPSLIQVSIICGGSGYEWRSISLSQSLYSSVWSSSCYLIEFFYGEKVIQLEADTIEIRCVTNFMALSGLTDYSFACLPQKSLQKFHCFI